MNRCPITYEFCGVADYSSQGLQSLARGLQKLRLLPYTQTEQRRESLIRMEKMSIQGVQSKLSAILEIKKETFTVVDIGGKYILKPQSENYSQLPQNEDVTMKLARLCDIETPLHGLIYDKNRELTYFIRRFDRKGRSEKIPVEDFAQLSGRTRDTKYDSSIEQVVGLIDEYATFPLVEKIQLLRRLIFCWLTGNEDMHLKNFSLMTENGITRLSPAYDLLNTSIALVNAQEESALPLNGKKKHLSRHLFIEYLGKERMKLLPPAIADAERTVSKLKDAFRQMLTKSFLSPAMQKKYGQLVESRLMAWSGGA